MKTDGPKILPWSLALSVMIHALVLAGVRVDTFRHKSGKESVYAIQFLKEGGGSLDRRPRRAEPAVSAPRREPKIANGQVPSEPQPVKMPKPDAAAEEETFEKEERPVEESAAEAPTLSSSHFGESSTREVSGGGPGRMDWRSLYGQKVLARIRSARRYPFAARRMSLEGRVVVEFTVSSSGRLEKVELVKGSGHSILDSDAVAWVRRAAPFPPLPPQARGDSLTFTYGLTYELRD